MSWLFVSATNNNQIKKINSFKNCHSYLSNANAHLSINIPCISENKNVKIKIYDNFFSSSENGTGRVINSFSREKCRNETDLIKNL